MSWKRHFRVIKGQQQALPSNIDANRWGGSGSINSNLASYLPLVYAGHPNRIQRYYQFDDMDRDSDINAALDTIADFCTQSEEQSDEPFEVHYHSDPNESETKIIKTMMEKWVKLNKFRSRLWYMFRDTLKNGDAFYLRDPETQEWLWLDHFMVEMVKVDDTLGKEPDEYLVRGLDYNKQSMYATKKADPNQYRTPYGTSNVGAARAAAVGSASGPAAFSLAGTAVDPRQRHMMGPFAQEVSVVDAQYVVHLSLSIGNDINWPFGPSILEPIFKTYKQKELLEDAIIIYRVQRAPERRIFYIDTGMMPPERAKRHIEAIKNDIHQRRIPNRTGTGGSILDAAYNPLSINDDYFFAQCCTLTTPIPLLDGRTLTLQQIIDEYNDEKTNWVYSLNLQTHELEPGRISWAGVTRRNAELVRVTLDNGEHVDVTPDHPFIMRDGSEKLAGDLDAGDSLMPLYLREGRTGPRQKNAGYTRYVCNATGKTKFVHTQICPKPSGRDWVVHHKDFDGKNNNPDNLEVMSWRDHEELHRRAGTYSLGTQWADPKARDKLIAGMHRLYAEATPAFQQKLSDRNRANGINTWKDAKTASRVRASLRLHCDKQIEERTLVYTPELFQRLVELYDQGHDSVKKMRAALRTDEVFLSLYRAVNTETRRTKSSPEIGHWISDVTLNKIVQTAGYETWGDFKSNYAKNHKVISVEKLSFREDTGDITVESASDSHVFALAAGIYVHNSQDGRGSKVETLPGGEQTGEISDLMFFSRKLARGLRVPVSYLNLGEDEGNSNVTFQDGKLGAAMIQEYRFSKFCSRLQSLLAPIFDKEFKRYLVKNGVEMDWSLFELRFTPPQSFTRYRQIELDAQRMQVYSGVAENRRLAERFKLQRYLGLTEDEIIENEKMWSEENAAKLKQKTGASPAESDAGADLGAVGIRSGDEGMPPDLDIPPEEGAEGAEGGGAMPGAPGGGAPGPAAPPSPGGAAGAAPAPAI